MVKEEDSIVKILELQTIIALRSNNSKPKKFMNIDKVVEFLEAMEDEIPTNCQHETVDITELP